MNRLIVSLIFLSALILAFFAGWWWRGNYFPAKKDSLAEKIIPKPLDVYSIENLAKSSYPQGKFDIADNSLFKFSFQPNPKEKETKTTTGVINIPKMAKPEDKFPLVVMLRGYVDPTIYSPGVGTQRAADYFSKNGFITVAPDFLGYAESDPNADNIFESRFQTHTLVLSLLNSVDQIQNWDKKNIFIWAHSNGGQIALTSLEVSGKNIPTVLWAPVSKPFPYSILYYTDESEDRGKLIRRELAKFEELYDTDKYSLDLYLDQINSPIQLHQGTADDAVIANWSDSLYKTLKAKEKEINYFVYPGADHNMQPGWAVAVKRSLEFYQKHLQK